jgi:hypothetical protein
LWGQPKAVANWQSEHRAILDAIMAGDVAQAPLFVLNHLDKGHRRLTEALTGVPAGPVSRERTSRPRRSITRATTVTAREHRGKEKGSRLTVS